MLLNTYQSSLLLFLFAGFAGDSNWVLDVDMKPLVALLPGKQHILNCGQHKTSTTRMGNSGGSGEDAGTLEQQEGSL